MWAVHPNPPAPSFPLIPRPAKGFVSLALSATSQHSRHRSSPNRKKQQQQHRRIQKHEGENEKQRGAATNQLSGLDVLRAMQRASAEKNRAAIARSKNNQKRKESLSAGGQGDEYAVDYSNVRPLNIKNEWGDKLDELEQRLKELSETR